MKRGDGARLKGENMRNHVVLGVFAVAAASCATTEQEAFDPEADPRIGEAVERVCFPSNSTTSGGYRRIGDRDAFVTGRFNEQYLLVFSRGCGDLGPVGSFPVFRNYGDNCRRVGEPVRTANSTIGVTGGCTIQHIYEWKRNADEEAPEDEEAAES